MKYQNIYFEDFKIGRVFKTDSMKITQEDIINFAKSNIAAYKYPRLIEFFDSLPFYQL